DLAQHRLADRVEGHLAGGRGQPLGARRGSQDRVEDPAAREQPADGELALGEEALLGSSPGAQGAIGREARIVRVAERDDQAASTLSRWPRWCAAIASARVGQSAAGRS
ncbi:MAG TPA: hypothetical protein DEA08_17575, partial [Planctomycetes bacterium]|nr:hypothetical protein [Planctomycetota bacterium]